jgi:hypothetical protein
MRMVNGKISVKMFAKILDIYFTVNTLLKSENVLRTVLGVRHERPPSSYVVQ